MIKSLAYNQSTVVENFHDDGISMGCVHLGAGDQQALYLSADLAVLFYGYLTDPCIPPRAQEAEPAAAARMIHDLYLQYGTAAFNKLSGAFAISLWDRRKALLILATDRFGLRPIYYAEHGGVFRFASEVKAIVADDDFPRQLNIEAVADFFHFAFILGDKTLFQDVNLLSPASHLLYHNGGFRVCAHWDLQFPDNYPHHPDCWYSDLISTALDHAVKKMIKPNLQYALSLSGGLDSRWIAGYLAKYKPDSLAFTLGTDGSDDTPLAREVARKTGLHHHYWEISPEIFAENAENYIYLTDGMDHLWHMEEYPLTIRVGDYANVSVGGFLGDGLFGYEINPISYFLRKQDITRYRLWRTRGSRLSASLMIKVFGEKRAKDLIASAETSLRTCFNAAPCEHNFQILQYFDIRQPERRLANTAQLAKLSYVDIYHPIADQDVVQAALQLPADQLIFERAYRRAMATHLPELAQIPWTFTLTPPTISVLGVMLKKSAQLTFGKWLQGTTLGQHPLIRPRKYYVNYHSWTRGPLRQFIESTLFSPESNSLGLFKSAELHETVTAHMEGNLDITSFLGTALTLAIWSRQFFAS